MNWALSERGEVRWDVFVFILSVRVNHILNSTIELGVENYSNIRSKFLFYLRLTVDFLGLFL